MHMRQQRSISFSEHRFARLVAWLAALLFWLASGAPTKRHGHRRRRHVSLNALRRALRNLILIRAAQLLPRHDTRIHHVAAPAGFRLHRKRCTLRACGGAWLRRHLRAQGGVIAQAKHLLQALSQIGRLAAVLAKRRWRGLTRLRVLRATAPPAQCVTSREASAPCGVDSS